MFPYKVKNPVKTFPAITYALIAINLLVFLLTIGPDFQIREQVVRDWAFMLAPNWPVRMLTAMFLHAGVSHILFNMYFLWLFGPAVEDRLGKDRYLATYLAAGIAGDVLQVMASGSVSIPSLGASGAIMGVLGAYWWLFSWSPVCVVYGFYFTWGITEIDAVWLIGLYILQDLITGMLLPAGGGVAHFAHVGGAAFGVLMCIAMRLLRDDRQVSEAKAYEADSGGLDNMSLGSLDVLRHQSPADPQVFKAFAMAAAQNHQLDQVGEALKSQAAHLIDVAPQIVAMAMVDLQAPAAALTPVQYLKLASELQSSHDSHTEAKVLQTLLHAYPQAPEGEAALFRLGKLYAEEWKDPASARMYLNKQLQQFPDGSLSDYARNLVVSMHQAVQRQGA